MRRNVRVVAALFAVLMAGACSSRQPPVQPVPDATRSAPPPQTSQPPVNGSSSNAEREAEFRRITAILEQMVFFDYDESVIRADAQEALAAKVPHLQASPSVRVRIDGHADERGSVEYNLALGMRRAHAVKDYLTGFGLDPQRFETNSLGEDRPLSSGTSEAAWTQNRRAEFRVAGRVNAR